MLNMVANLRISSGDQGRSIADAMGGSATAQCVAALHTHAVWIACTALPGGAHVGHLTALPDDASCNTHVW